MLLTDLIADAGGVVTDPAVHNDILAHYVVATGSDGYSAVYSLGQLGDGGEDGFARMVAPGDAAGGRYVSNLVSIEVVDIDHGPGQDPVWG